MLKLRRLVPVRLCTEGLRMNRIDNVDVLAITPSSIASDVSIQGLAEALSTQLQKVNGAIDSILLLPNLSSIPEEALDVLAWQFSVDFYTVKLDRQTKENLIRNSVAWHRRKGTVSVVEDIVFAVYGSAAKVLENWDYGGRPYHFKVEIEGAQSSDQATMESLTTAIMSVKNVRSWMDGFEFKQTLNSKLYFGGSMYAYKEVLISG